MKLYRNGKLIEDTVIYATDEIAEEHDIFCMSNLRGNTIKVPHKLPFSFYFSARESSHAIRVKPVFNPNKISKSSFGTLELHGSWEYTPDPDDKNVSNKQIREMKDFFKTYKVLFAAVWEEELPDDALQDYFKGHILWQDLLGEFYFYEDYKSEMKQIKNIIELERFVRKNNLFNMWD
ncbi:MAG: hypothetical protein NC489_18155 [Ruminococcus flavefaciens]|nr:hypothetical protein [Ruminococcus flavefaciens]